MLRLLIICLATTSVFAVSNPEIITKSGKSSSSSPSVQHVTQKTATQHAEPLLNSINAYAQQYDSPTASKPYIITTQLYSQPYTPQSTSYKFSSSPQLPSSPTVETNFQPIPSSPHHQSPVHIHPRPQGPPAPVIMQYVPQSQLTDGGVQYLQLIPARPLIVPISPYMSPMSQAAAYQSPQIISSPPNEYSGPDPVSSIPYGVQSYANSAQNYRSYRINREIKPNDSPTGMSLNINEYMPSPNDAPKPMAMIRGRP